MYKKGSIKYADAGVAWNGKPNKLKPLNCQSQQHRYMSSEWTSGNVMYHSKLYHSLGPAMGRWPITSCREIGRASCNTEGWRNTKHTWPACTQVRSLVLTFTLSCGVSACICVYLHHTQVEFSWWLCRADPPLPSFLGFRRQPQVGRLMSQVLLLAEPSAGPLCCLWHRVSWSPAGLELTMYPGITLNT